MHRRVFKDEMMELLVAHSCAFRIIVGRESDGTFLEEIRRKIREVKQIESLTAKQAH